MSKDGKRLIAICDERKDIIAGDDGFFIFWPARITGGALTADNLRTIADELDRRNAPWQKEIDEYFAKECVAEEEHYWECFDAPY